MPSTTPLWSSVEEALTREVWFSDPNERTASKCVSWLRELSDSPTGIGKDLHEETVKSLGENYTQKEHERYLHSWVADFLRRTCVGGIIHVDDLPSAAQALFETLGSAENTPRRLALDSTLRELLSRHPGGELLLETHSFDQVRNFLATDSRFDDFLGPELLRDFLSGDTVRERDFRPACAVVEKTGFFLDHLVFPAILADLTPDEENGRLGLLSQLSASKLTPGNRPLVMFSPHRLSEALRKFVQANETNWSKELCEEFSEALLVLAPTRYRTRECYTGAFTLLRDTVLSHLAEESNMVLPARLDSSPTRKADNWAKFCSLVGGIPDRLDLRVYPSLRKHLAVPYGVQPARVRPLSRRNRRSPKLADFFSVVDFLDEWVKANKQLPATDELSSAQLESIERITNRTYRDFTKALHEQHGARFPRPRRSNNELVLDALVRETFSSSFLSDSFTVEWSDAGTFGNQSRIDLYAKLVPETLSPSQSQPVELFVEADGEGHFVQVANFTPVKEYRQSDRDKARALHKRWQAGSEMVMVNIHHRLLTGPQKLRLSSDQLLAATKAAFEQGHWWVFLRPEGCDEYRQTPGGKPVVLDASIEGVELLGLEDDQYTSGQLCLAVG